MMTPTGIMAARQEAHRRSWRRQFADATALLDEWRCRSRGRRALAKLSDRDLRDIGVTRNDACYEMRKPFWRA